MTDLLQTFSIKFEGRVLSRGFWVYVVDIRPPEARHLYVGRTGDSSSPNAASPFSRIGAHLDFRPNAKGNALRRNLDRAGIDPTSCRFEMIAVGPVFPEQTDLAAHKPFRDSVAALERDVAHALRERGYSVLGTHSASAPAEPELLREVLALIEGRLTR